MLTDANKLENHEYCLYIPKDGKNDPKIIYRQHHSFAFNSNLGYYTKYAYIQEWEKNNITETAMNKNLSMIINLGMYSYNKIPSQYKLILGVSGTLNDMRKLQKDLTNNTFNIQQITILPSKYGRKKLDFDETKDIYILPSQEAYYEKLIGEI